MKLWIDDVRPMPEGFDRHAKTASEAIEIIKACDRIEEISFDHDLGNDADGTGYDVAKFIEEQAYRGIKPPPLKWSIHSANPVGRQNIRKAMESAERFAALDKE